MMQCEWQLSYFISKKKYCFILFSCHAHTRTYTRKCAGRYREMRARGHAYTQIDALTHTDIHAHTHGRPPHTHTRKKRISQALIKGDSVSIPIECVSLKKKSPHQHSAHRLTVRAVAKKGRKGRVAAMKNTATK